MEDRVPELRDTLAVLWRRKLIIITAIVATTAASLWYSTRQPNVYQATSRIVIRSLSPQAALAALGDKASTGDVAAETQSEIIRSEVVGERVGKVLGLTDIPPSLLAGTISTRVVTGELIDITASSRSPQFAAQLANAFAEEYLLFRRETASAGITSASEELRRRIDDLQKHVDDLDARIVHLAMKAARYPLPGPSVPPDKAAARAEAETEIRRLSAERDSNIVSLATTRNRYEDVRASEAAAGGGTQIQKAAVPGAPSSPKPRRDGIVGLLLGAILGAGLAFMREHFDDRIRGTEDASRAAGVPVLAAVPRARFWRRKREAYLAMVREPGSQTAEAYRHLRQSLVAMGLGSEFRSVLITSGGAGAGKSASTANLAVACAQAGLRVIAVSGDLRRPRLHEFFGVGNEAGLAQVLGEGMAVQRSLKPTGIANVTLMPAGPPTDKAAGLLDGTRLDTVMAELVRLADVVLIDSPPLASGADAMVLAPRSDVAVVVLRQQMARSEGAAAAVHELRQAGSRRIATVLNLGSGTAARRYAPYGYTAASNGRGANGHASAPAAAVTPANGSAKPNDNGNGNGHAGGIPVLPTRLDEAALDVPPVPRGRDGGER